MKQLNTMKIRQPQIKRMNREHRGRDHRSRNALRKNRKQSRRPGGADSRAFSFADTACRLAPCCSLPDLGKFVPDCVNRLTNDARDFTIVDVRLKRDALCIPKLLSIHDPRMYHFCAARGRAVFEKIRVDRVLLCVLFAAREFVGRAGRSAGLSHGQTRAIRPRAWFL